MPRVGGDVQIRTALEFHKLGLALEFDGGAPFQNDDPFVAFLIVPAPVGRVLLLDGQLRKAGPVFKRLRAGGLGAG